MEIFGLEKSITSDKAIHTISFPIPFININYRVIMGYQGTYSPGVGVLQDSKTINGCNIKWSDENLAPQFYYAVGKWK